MSWERILDHWDLLEADLQDAGVDLEDPRTRARSWRWFRVRVSGILTKPTTITPDGRSLQSTRLGLTLYPPQ